MKKLKYTAIIGVILFLISIDIVYLIRVPDYKIQTNGKLYIVNKRSSTITIFDLFKGEELAEIPMDITPHELIAVPCQNKVVVTNYGGPSVVGKSISIINSKTDKFERNIALEGSSRPHGIIAFPESNNVGVVTDIGNDLLVVDIETAAVKKKIPTKQLMSHLLTLHPNKPIAFVTNVVSSSVSVVDLDRNKVLKVIPCGLGAEGLDITPNGDEVWITNSKENTISVINTSSLQITHTIPTGKESLRLKFSIDGVHCFVSNAGDGTVTVYDRNLKKKVHTIVIPGKKNLLERALYSTPRPVGILMHPNGFYAFVSNSNANKIEVIDMRTFTIVSTIGTGKVPDGLAFVE